MKSETAKATVANVKFSFFIGPRNDECEKNIGPTPVLRVSGTPYCLALSQKALIIIIIINLVCRREQRNFPLTYRNV